MCSSRRCLCEWQTYLAAFSALFTAYDNPVQNWIGELLTPFWHDSDSTSSARPERARHMQSTNRCVGVEQTQAVRLVTLQIETVPSCIANLVILALLGSYARLTHLCATGIILAHP